MLIDHPYTIVSKPRQLRIVFLVQQDYSLKELRSLVLKNLQLWGGRYNPIIPVNDNSITQEWKKLLGFQDPDYIYYSTGIDRAFLLELCDEFGINPVEIVEIDKNFNNIYGLHWANILPSARRTVLFQPERLWEISSPLIDYYKLNFLVEDNAPLETGLFKNHQLSVINKENFPKINQILSTPFIKNTTKLSELNTTNWKLRQLNPTFHHFQLVVSADNKGFDELIYHWNKILFDLTHRDIQTLFITETELRTLLKDEDFKFVLKNLSGQDIGIEVVSFSLSKSEVAALIEELESFSHLNRFERKEIPMFPFEIRDREGYDQQTQYEKETTQVIFKSQPFIFLPALSFSIDFKPFSQSYGFELRISEVLGPFNQSLRFPSKLHSDYYTRTNSRIDRKREIFVTINESRHNEGKLELLIPNFYDVISLVITSPKITGEKTVRNLYRNIKYSDGSNKMAQFLRLFDNDFIFLDNFLNDKFWSDIFIDLSTNNKSEGDTILFESIFQKCFNIMIELGKEFKPKGESRFNEENLRLGLKNTLQRLIENKIFLPGFVIKCNYCSSRIWYSLADTKEQIVCKGCSNVNHFNAENPISYKLNHLVKNNIGMVNEKGVFQPDGNMTAIRTLIYLSNMSVNSFKFLPQIDIFDCTESNKPKTDLDIVVVSSGDFYIGECKHNSNLFFEEKNKSLLNLIDIANTAKPDKIILSCTIDESGKLAKAAQFIRHNIINWKSKPMVIEYKAWTPTYFGSNESSYFYY